jgi:hypothetical protein
MRVLIERHSVPPRATGGIVMGGSIRYNIYSN